MQQADKSNSREISKKNRRFVLLDTSFILTCIKQKIDFFDELEMEGIEILIPKQVLIELEGLAIRNSNARLALILIREKQPEIIDIKNKNVDRGIIAYSKFHKDIIIASLDREIKKMTKNKKIVIRGKKRLEII